MKLRPFHSTQRDPTVRNPRTFNFRAEDQDRVAQPRTLARGKILVSESNKRWGQTCRNVTTFVLGMGTRYAYYSLEKHGKVHLWLLSRESNSENITEDSQLLRINTSLNVAREFEDESVKKWTDWSRRAFEHLFDIPSNKIQTDVRSITITMK